MQTNQKKKKENQCPVCDSVTTTKVIEIYDVPVFCNVLWDSREEALNAARGNINLFFCHTCGHIYNEAFDPNRMQYSPRYENTLDYSPTFREYVVSLAERLVRTYDLHDKDIIEIGCGKGEFLRLLAEMGENRCIGFDPSYDPSLIDQDHLSDRFFVIRDYYSEQYSSYSADFIACRQVLEHVKESKSFLTMIRRALGGKQKPLVFVEVPNVMFTLKEFGIWDLIYEHCSYFTALSLSRLFAEAGYNPLKVAETFGGQFLCIEAVPLIDKKQSSFNPQNLSIEEVENYVKGFADNYRKMISKWENKLEKMQRSGIEPVVWGAGSKGITFLNVLKSDGKINYVVDINPHKQGLYVPGTGQQVVTPDLLADIRPEAIIVMNPLYVSEIEKMITKRQLGTDRNLRLMYASDE
jgi:SAM-dependent methyltransferase